MPRRYPPKKSLAVVHIKGPAGLLRRRDACRYYVFALAEELYQKKFAELKERALPLYRATMEHRPTPLTMVPDASIIFDAGTLLGGNHFVSNEFADPQEMLSMLPPPSGLLRLAPLPTPLGGLATYTV